MVAACGAESPPEVVVAKTWQAACAEARASGGDVLVWLRREDAWRDDEREVAVKQLLQDRDARPRWVPFEVVVQGGRAGAPLTAAGEAPPWLVDVGRRVPLCGRSGPEGNLGPSVIQFDAVLPSLVLCDGDGRPVGGLAAAEAASLAWPREQIASLREQRRRRDGAFGEARRASGATRAAALRTGLQVLDRWWVVRCYGPELTEVLEGGDSVARGWAAVLRNEQRLLLGCEVLADAWEHGPDEQSPDRLRRQVLAAAAAFGDQPDVQLVARCCAAMADLRLAISDQDREAIRAQLRAASELAPRSQLAIVAKGLLLELDR